MDGRAIGGADGRPTNGRTGGRVTGLAMASEIYALKRSHGSGPYVSRSHRSSPQWSMADARNDGRTGGRVDG